MVEIFEAEAEEVGGVDGATTAAIGAVIATLISETGARVLHIGMNGVENGNATGATETAFEADGPRPEEGRHR